MVDRSRPGGGATARSPSVSPSSQEQVIPWVPLPFWLAEQVWLQQSPSC
jgi:hypothetical protein